jgi:hypothetical protein
MDMTAAILIGVLLAGQADVDPSVLSGRQALDPWSLSHRYPWYDSAKDSIARVDVSKPWEPNWNGPSFDGSAVLEWMAWFMVALAIAGVLYLLLRAYRDRQPGQGDYAGTEAAGASDSRRIEALPLLEGRQVSDFLAEAARCYQQGDYRRAVVYLFSHQLLQLDKHQLIHLAKGKTNRQYLRELGGQTSLRRLLEHTMLAFEDVFFGNRGLDHRRFESCWQRLDEFEALLAKGAAG